MGKLSLMIISCLIKEIFLLLLLLLLFSIQVNILNLKHHHHLLCVEEYIAEHIIFKSTLFIENNKLYVCLCVSVELIKIRIVINNLFFFVDIFGR